MAAYFNIFLIVMALLALAVYIALHYFEAGYGYLFNRKYGFPIPNRIGWVLMECPVFIAMTVLWLLSDRTWEAAPLALLILFQGHYLQRAFIFPLLIRGNSKMPAGIVGMGMLFNTLNALMQGGWIFYISPADYYEGWFSKPPSAQAGRYTPLHSPGRYVPLRFVGQLFRRADRMGGLRHRFVVMGRGSIRLVDLRQPRPPRSFALQTIRKRVRAGIHLPAPKEDHTFHLLSFQL